MFNSNCKATLCESINFFALLGFIAAAGTNGNHDIICVRRNNRAVSGERERTTSATAIEPIRSGNQFVPCHVCFREKVLFHVSAILPNIFSPLYDYSNRRVREKVEHLLDTTFSGVSVSKKSL